MSDSNEETEDDISRIKQAMRTSRIRSKFLDQIDEIEQPTSPSRVCPQELARLEAQLALQAKEILYLKKKLNSYDKSVVKSKNMADLKFKAAESEMHDLVKKYRRSWTQKSQEIHSKVVELLPLVDALERNSLHGRHLIPSETNMSIFMRMRQIVQELVKSGLESSRTDLDQNYPVESVPDTTLFDICRGLETENENMKVTLSSLQEEVISLRSRAAKSDLIPQYRSVIIRYKTDTAILEDNLRRFQTRNEELQNRLEEAITRSEGDQNDIKRLKSELIQMRQERDRFKSAVGQIIHQSQGDPIPERELKKPRNPSDFSILNSLFQTRERVTSTESNVQQDLELLDSEIGDLRRRLEAAAAIKTQNLVREAIRTPISNLS